MYLAVGWGIMHGMRKIAALTIGALLVLVAPAADAVSQPPKCRVVSVEKVKLFEPDPTPRLATVTMTINRCRGDLVVVVDISYQPA